LKKGKENKGRDAKKGDPLLPTIEERKG